MAAALLPACRVTACAKLNLDLRVLAVRPDGYHALATVFQSIELGDVLHITPGGPRDLELSCSDAGVPCDERNLAWRAAQALRRALGIDLPPLRVRIDKVIPAEAGLGGGSADAAAMLAGLNAMLGLRASRDDLASVAATVGADVPFMLLGGTVLGTGRGDVLHPLPDLPPHEVVVVHPGFGVSTREAYGWFDEGGPPENMAPVWPKTSAGWGPVLPACRNDLQPAVCRRHPAIAELVDALTSQGAQLAAMTGSGSAVFGLFPVGGPARDIAARLAGGGRFVTVARTLGRAEFDRVTRPVLVGDVG